MIPYSTSDLMSLYLCRISPSGGQLVESELPQRVVDRGLGLLNPMHGIRRHHEKMVDTAQLGHFPALVARQADGEQATPARLLEGAHEVGRITRSRQPDDDVTAPPERCDLPGEDDVK